MTYLDGILSLSGPRTPPMSVLAEFRRGDEVVLVTDRDPNEVRRVLNGQAPSCPPWRVVPPYPEAFFIRDGNGRYVAGGDEAVCEALVAKANGARTATP